VTKSVISILIGIAIGDGVIASIGQPLAPSCYRAIAKP
jgi:hypothetical protein